MSMRLCINRRFKAYRSNLVPHEPPSVTYGMREKAPTLIETRFERLDAFELKMRHRSLRYGGIQILIDEVAQVV